ncbi:MAG TPA: hypothetical protein VIW24_20440 [Aldersonia sp.]
MATVLLTARRVEKIAATLETAGDDWEAVAAGMDIVAEVMPGDAITRDRVRLHSGWAMEVNEGTEVVACPPIMYRTETGEWRAVGWSTASEDQIYRPSGVEWDPDAGVHVLAGVEEGRDFRRDRALRRVAAAAAAAADRDDAIRAALQVGASVAEIARAARVTTKRIYQIRDQQ